MNEQNLIPWKPGQSGNPAGMAKGTKQWSTIIAEAFEHLDSDEGKKMLAHIVKRFYAKDKVLITMLPFMFNNGKAPDAPNLHQTNILQFLEQSVTNGEVIDKSIDARYKRAIRAAEHLRPNRNGDDDGPG